MFTNSERLVCIIMHYTVIKINIQVYTQKIIRQIGKIEITRRILQKSIRNKLLIPKVNKSSIVDGNFS